jgi:hypothetical protein
MPKPRALLNSVSTRSRALVTKFFLLTLFIYGEDIRTIAELYIDDYLYLDVKVYNVSGLPPLMLPPPNFNRWILEQAGRGFGRQRR